MAKKFNFIKKFLLILFFIWSLLVIVFFLITVYHNHNDAVEMAIEKAKTSVDKDLAYRTWVSSHGGVYVPVTKRTPPNKYLSHIKNRDFRVNDINYTLMNPAYTLSQMMHDYTRLYGIKTKITSTNLLNPKNAPDKWETFALEKIDETRKQFYELSDIDNKEYLRLMNPLVIKESCLKCHAHQGYKLGDLRGGVSVSIPMEKLNNNAFNHDILYMAMFILLWLIGSGFLFYIYKKLQNNYNEKQKMYEQYIYGLVDIVEKRDYYTAGHSKRVAKYSKLLAKAIGLDKNQQDFIYKAAMLHDIGKIAIPDSVFLKPNKLNNSEYKMIQEHVNISYTLLQNMDVFKDIAEIVKDHHEKYDGSGYPNGKKGEDTDIMAQILSLCDAFDAMTTNRIYKKKKSLSEALEEIKSLSGKQFNPTLTKFALKVFDNENLLKKEDNTLKTPLDKERFEYFFKDPLTHLFNKDYLNIKLNETNNYNFLYLIITKNFSNYNKKYGWEEGDIKLINFSSYLCENLCSKGLLFRIWGDDFVFLSKEEHDIENILKPIIEDFKSYNLQIIIQKFSTKKDNINHIKDLSNKVSFI